MKQQTYLNATLQHLKMKYSYILLLLLFSASCVEIEKPKTEHKINFIILLDLSDRLLTVNQQINDIEIIKNLFRVFKDTVRLNKHYIKSSDYFKIRIAYQKNSKINFSEIENSLSLNLEKLPINKKKSAIHKFSNSLDSLLNNLYAQAKISKNPKKYFGADIWKYFNDELESDIITDSLTTNYLYIITDGYLYFENFDKSIRNKNRFSSCEFMKNLRGNDWETKFSQNDYGIIPVNKKLDNLKVMLLEINPKNEYLNEYSLLKKIWLKWLLEMKISSVKICKKTSINKTKDGISDFLNSKNLNEFKSYIIPKELPIPEKPPKKKIKVKPTKIVPGKPNILIKSIETIKDEANFKLSEIQPILNNLTEQLNSQSETGELLITLKLLLINQKELKIIYEQNKTEFSVEIIKIKQTITQFQNQINNIEKK